MNDKKIEKFLHWDEPVIYYKDDTFEFEIKEKEIEICCDWDYGYGGRGTERIYISTDVLLKLIKDVKKIK